MPRHRSSIFRPAKGGSTKNGATQRQRRPASAPLTGSSWLRSRQLGILVPAQRTSKSKSSIGVGSACSLHKEARSLRFEASHAKDHQAGFCLPAGEVITVLREALRAMWLFLLYFPGRVTFSPGWFLVDYRTARYRALASARRDCATSARSVLAGDSLTATERARIKRRGLWLAVTRRSSTAAF